MLLSDIQQAGQRPLMAVPAMAQIVTNRVLGQKTPHEFRQSRRSTAQRYVGTVRYKRPAVN